MLRAYLEPLLAAQSADRHPAARLHALSAAAAGRSRRSSGEGVAVVDSAFTTALAVEDLLDALGCPVATRRRPRGHRVATTGDVEAFVSVASRLFGERLPEVEAVAIEPAGAIPLD